MNIDLPQNKYFPYEYACVRVYIYMCVSIYLYECILIACHTRLYLEIVSLHFKYSAVIFLRDQPLNNFELWSSSAMLQIG